MKQTNMQGRRLFYGAFVDWNDNGVSDNPIPHPTESTGQDPGYDARGLAESFLSPTDTVMRKLLLRLLWLSILLG